MIYYTAASGIWQTVWLEAVPERYNRAFKLLPDVDKQELKLTIDFLSRGKTIDEVKSYFGMRKFSIEKDSRGVKRLFLNNQPLFQNGSLDQGYWPDGLFTAPTDEALRYDLEITKQVGFYMTSNNIKIEPAH